MESSVLSYSNVIYINAKKVKDKFQPMTLTQGLVETRDACGWVKHVLPYPNSLSQWQNIKFLDSRCYQTNEVQGCYSVFRVIAKSIIATCLHFFQSSK